MDAPVFRVINQLLFFSVGVIDDHHCRNEATRGYQDRLLVFLVEVAHGNLLVVRRHKKPGVKLKDREKCEEDRTKQAEKASEARAVLFTALVVQLHT